MNSRYNLRSRNNRNGTGVDSDMEEVAKILCQLRFKNSYMEEESKTEKTDEYVEVMDAADEEWVNEKADEDIVREACSCISRRLDPPERFFELLRMYDGGELSDELVSWMYSIPPIQRCMDNKSYRRSSATRLRMRREKTEAVARLHPLTRSENRVGFSTNLVDTSAMKDQKRIRNSRLYNLRSLNAVTTTGSQTHRYNTRSTTNGTRTD
jgi:hypothetical protein